MEAAGLRLRFLPLEVVLGFKGAEVAGAVETATEGAGSVVS